MERLAKLCADLRKYVNGVGSCDSDLNDLKGQLWFGLVCMFERMGNCLLYIF